MQNSRNVQDLIGMAWSDKISFEEIKKKLGLPKKKFLALWGKLSKKIVTFYGGNVWGGGHQNIEN